MTKGSLAPELGEAADGHLEESSTGKAGSPNDEHRTNATCTVNNARPSADKTSSSNRLSRNLRDKVSTTRPTDVSTSHQASAPVHGLPDGTGSQSLSRLFRTTSVPGHHVSNDPPQRIPLKPRHHVHFAPKSKSKQSTDLKRDLVLIYMFSGDSPNSDLSFFDDPSKDNAPHDVGATRLTPSRPFPEPQDSLTKSASAAKVPSIIAPPAATSKSNWLNRDNMLPAALPYTRTICIGYDLRTKSAPGQSQINFQAAASEMLSILREERKDCPDRPAILIGHGYGCRVIQYAAEHDHIDDNPSPLQGVCAGIISYQAPPDSLDPTVSDLLTAAGKAANIHNPATATPSAKVNHKADAQALGKLLQERLISYYNMVSDGEKSLAFGFATPSNQDFQLICVKVVEWSETFYLMHAIEKADLKQVENLVTKGLLPDLVPKGIDVNQRKNAASMTALHVACETRSSGVDLVAWLVKNGADVTLVDSRGKTPLHYAVMRKPQDAAMVRVLLEAGAQSDLPDAQGDTPRRLAQNNAAGKEMKDLVRQPPPISGPSAVEGSMDRAEPGSSLAKEACSLYDLVATEVYLHRDNKKTTEKHLTRTLSVAEAVYGSTSLSDIFKKDRIDDIADDQLICQWYHLPANNMTWINDLFQNQFKTSLSVSAWPEQLRASKWPHGRCIDSHADRFTTDSGESVLAICMPYVSYQDNERQRSISQAITRQHRMAEEETRMQEFSHSGRILSHLLQTVERVEFRLRQHREHADVDLTNINQPNGKTNPLLTIPQGRRKSLSPAEEKSTESKSTLSGNRPSMDDPSPSQSPIRAPSPDSGSESDASDFPRPPSMSKHEKEESLVRAYLRSQPPLHIRRTLDQYHYYMLEDTEERDADQVVTRWAERKLHQSQHNILMVDQLWLWIIRDNREDPQGRSVPDKIISCFPERQGFKSKSLDDLQHNVLNRNIKKRRMIKGSADLVSRIISTCSEVFSLPPQDHELVQFLRFFEATVGSVGNTESKLLKKFKRQSEELHNLREKHRDYAKRKDRLLIKMLDVRPQTDLLEEVKDIRDEIGIILHVLGEQGQVLRTTTIAKFFSSKEHTATDPGNACTESLRIVDQAIGIFERMSSQMKEVHDGLLHLLDLQQKQASVWEARSAREGALEASKQGNVMLVFTMVTIIFLPLSFMASFFALDVAQFPEDPDGHTNWPLRRVCGYLFGISFAVIIPFIALAFITDRLRRHYLWAKHGFFVPMAVVITRLFQRLPGKRHKERCRKKLRRLERRRKDFHGEARVFSDESSTCSDWSDSSLYSNRSHETDPESEFGHKSIYSTMLSRQRRRRRGRRSTSQKRSGYSEF